MEKHSRPAIWYLTTAASLFVGLAPIIVLEKCYGVPRKIMVGFGVLAWLIGVVAIKWPIYRFFIDKAVRRGANHRLVACIQGILSGVSELGIAAAFFILVVKDLTLPQLIGFGAGAGMVEATTVPFIRNPFRGTALEGRASDLISGAAGNPICSGSRCWNVCGQRYYR